MNDILLTLFKQIGGSKTFFMLGAYNQVYSNEKNFISFFIKGCEKYNYIKISYNSLDLYDISFMKYAD